MSPGARPGEAALRERPASPDRRDLLLAIWPDTPAGGEALAERFYTRLFVLAPEVHRLFAATDMAAQRRKLAEMLRWMVASLDAPDALVPGTAALARRHVRYGVHDHDYDAVGEALRDALAGTLGDRFTPEVREAWAEAYALLAGVMRRAASRGGAA
ncbi:MAG: hemin receptor [Gemmatirosa sp.]|nr:hemin receptor [Gemmatirosa sp.]